MLLFKYGKTKKLFLFWGLLCVLFNVLCTFGDAYSEDQKYWCIWIQSLLDGGFEKYMGNYPPIYVLWLWVVAQVHSILGLVVDKTFFLKAMCLLPVYFSHLFLVDALCRIIGKFNYPYWKQHLLIGFVALNPVLLLDGPVWGQMDLFPVVLAMLAIYCICFSKGVLWASMFFVLAVMTKFQMIMFLPVFGGLFIRKWRISWKGLPLAVVAFVLAFLPFMVGGCFSREISTAYLQMVGHFPYATFNAANLWYLLVGNTVLDSVPVVGIDIGTLGFLLQPNWIGKFLFVLISIFVFVKSLLCRNLRTAFALCSLNALAFFVVLPEMHERYLVYAVPAVLCMSVFDMKKGGPFCLLITLVATANVLLVHPLRGVSVWTIISFATCLLLLAMLLMTAIPKMASKFVEWVRNVNMPVFVPYVLLAVVLVVASVEACCQLKLVSIEKTDKMKLITDLPLRYSEQAVGKVRMNQSVGGRALTSGKKVYKNGIGTHAPSRFLYELPLNADSLYFGAAIDGECEKSGNAIFLVRADGEVKWISGFVKAGAPPVFGAVSVKGARQLELLTDSNGDKECDHTDWLNVYVTLR